MGLMKKGLMSIGNVRNQEDGNKNKVQWGKGKLEFCCNTFKESGQECGKGNNREKPQAIPENKCYTRKETGERRLWNKDNEEGKENSSDDSEEYQELSLSVLPDIISAKLVIWY